MSDIDFDELDKAVNSLVGDNPSAEKKDQPAVPAPKAAETIEKPQTTSTPSLPSRRAGRFMDMKHDSSDMKKSNGPSMMNSKNNNLQPLNADVKPDEKPTAHKQEAKDNLPSPVTNQSLESQNSDLAAVGSSTNITDPSQKKDEPEIKFEETDPKKEDDTDDDKKPSPFIDDAKVEKRPLGGFSSDTPAEDQKDDDKKDDKSDEKDKDGDKKSSKEGEEEPVAPPAPIELPPELDKDLVAIEAGEAPENLKAEEPIPETEEADESSKEDDKNDDKDDNKDNEVKDEKESKKDHKDEVSQLLATAAGGSIPDQYKRENRSHELHTPHPLFDADHHKNAPVSAPKTPKSLFKKVFSWLFIATGILLGGASLGFAAFYFTSQL